MFSFLGHTVARYWPLVLAAWLGVVAASRLFAPAWDSVTQGGNTAFLPADADSRRGERLFQDAFPDQYDGCTVVLVVSRDEGGLREEDNSFIARVLTPAVKEAAAETASVKPSHPIGARVRSPEDPAGGALLRSRDGRAALVLVELTTDYFDRRNWPIIDRVEAIVTELRRGPMPAGLDVAITGSATTGRDSGRAQQQSAHDIEVWTFVVVVALLLLAYRAPLVALIPLATVYVAVEASLAALALLAQAQILTLSTELRVFITVIAYGAGVDYCVFLIDRYQEERARTPARRWAGPSAAPAGPSAPAPPPSSAASA
jgi:RND superfamily putative drug exporter